MVLKSKKNIGVVAGDYFICDYAKFRVNRLPAGYYELTDIFSRSLQPVLPPRPDLRFIYFSEQLFPENINNYRIKTGMLPGEITIENMPQGLPDYVIIGTKIIRKRLFFTQIQGINQKVQQDDLFGLSPEEKLIVFARQVKIAKAKELSLDEIAEQMKIEILERRETSAGRLLVHWRYKDIELRSLIDPETLAVVKAGFCLSGGDRKLNFINLPLIAYRAGADLYIETISED